jgi:hypothetical protein
VGVRVEQPRAAGVGEDPVVIRTQDGVDVEHEAGQAIGA